MRPMNKIGLCLFCCLSGSFLFAHSQEDTLQVYFRRGYAVLEPELRGNRETLEGLVVRLEAFRDDTAGCVSQLSLRGNASPDGMAAANVRLTRKRVEAVLSYLRQWVEIPDGLVEVQANGFDWRACSSGWRTIRSVRRDRRCSKSFPIRRSGCTMHRDVSWTGGENA